jgi:Spy/CpxP family protein refolding chaperone
VRSRTCLLFSALALVAAGTAFAAAPVAVERGRDDGLHHCLRILNLSDTQKTQIHDYLESQKPEVQVLNDTLESDREALREALDSGSTDACALGADVLTIQADREALAAKLEAVRVGVETFMTPDQKTRFEGCLDARRGGAISPGL